MNNIDFEKIQLQCREKAENVAEQINKIENNREKLSEYLFKSRYCEYIKQNKKYKYTKIFLCSGAISIYINTGAACVTVQQNYVCADVFISKNAAKLLDKLCYENYKINS